MDFDRYQQVQQWAQSDAPTTIATAVACMSDVFEQMEADCETFELFVADLTVVVSLARTFLCPEHVCLLPARYLTWLANALRSIAYFYYESRGKNSYDAHYFAINCMFERTQQTRLLLEGIGGGDDAIVAKGLFFYVNDSATEQLAAAKARWQSSFVYYNNRDDGKGRAHFDDKIASIDILLSNPLFHWCDFVRLAEDEPQ